MFPAWSRPRQTKIAQKKFNLEPSNPIPTSQFPPESPKKTFSRHGDAPTGGALCTAPTGGALCAAPCVTRCSVLLKGVRERTIDLLAYIKSGLPARSAKICALQNARELCFQWRIGENDARTLAYEVAAAAKPPQTTPLYLGTRVDTRGRNGQYRRRRAVGALASFLSHLSGKRRSKCAHRPGAPAAILAVSPSRIDARA